ncbi:uncharacterized protein OCT59_006111 [Rhizophagus irregularis]|nr:hypothetical protein OCT59_006111 [Rhizophagus irregularis]
MEVIRLTVGRWEFENVNEKEFNQAEKEKKKLIELKKIGPEFAEKMSSRSYLYNIIYKKMLYSLDANYISELESNIDTKSLWSQKLNSAIQNFSISSDSNYISTELELDIDTESFLSQNLNSTIQKFSTSLKKRGNEEFLNVDTHDNNGKRIKTSFNYP